MSFMSFSNSLSTPVMADFSIHLREGNVKEKKGHNLI